MSSPAAVDVEQLGGPAPVAEIPLRIYRGDFWARWLVLWADADRTEPVDLDGIEVAAQIRRTPDDRRAVDLMCVTELPNRIHISLTPEQSAVTPTGRWDLQLTYPSAGGWVTTVAAGPVTVTPDVTRPDALCRTEPPSAAPTPPAPTPGPAPTTRRARARGNAGCPPAGPRHAAGCWPVTRSGARSAAAPPAKSTTSTTARPTTAWSASATDATPRSPRPGHSPRGRGRRAPAAPVGLQGCLPAPGPRHQPRSGQRQPAARCGAAAAAPSAGNSRELRLAAGGGWRGTSTPALGSLSTHVPARGRPGYRVLPAAR